MEYAGKVLMILEGGYPVDTRVRNEAETLSRTGYRISIISWKEKSQTFFEIVNGVRVYRVPKITMFQKSRSYDPTFWDRMKYKILSTVGYIVEYLYFTLAAFLLSFYVLYKDGFDIIHSHNPPDTFFVIGGFFKLFGKKYVFDHHDLSPELYLTRFQNKRGILYSVLVLAEIMNLKLADLVIATNQSYKEMEMERGKIDGRKIFIVRNGPDLEKFRPVPQDPDLKASGKVILGYLGCMDPQDGVDYLLRALKYLVEKLGRTDFHCVLIGKGDSFDDLKDLSGRLGLNGYVTFTGYIPDAGMIRYLSTFDICLDPNPSGPLNDHSTWLKVMEYMALGKPIVSFDLKETRFTAQDAAVYVPPNDVAKYASAIETLMDDPEMRSRNGEKGMRRIREELHWGVVSQNLIKGYESLLR